MDFGADTDRILEELANVTVLAKLNGAVVATFRGIFDDNVEVVSPFQGEAVVLKPLLAAASSDLTGIDSSHVLEIDERQYKFDGKPRPDGHGLTVIHLAVKK